MPSKGVTGTIVVGVDGSTGSKAALRWALEESRLRGARLRCVHARALPPMTDSFGLGAGYTGLLLGSVSQQCAHHAPCPLVIVRGA